MARTCLSFSTLDCSSGVISPSSLPSSAAIRASSPAVDFNGSVMPNLNGPHGLPYFCQPSGAPANLLITSCQVSSAFGQPSASAMGLGIAMTAGVRARLGWRSGIMRSAISAEEARRTQALDSGTQTSGAVPCDLGSQSVPRACAMTAESLAATSTEAHLPWTDGPVSCQSRASFSNWVDITGDAAIVAFALPEHDDRFR